MRDMLEGAKAAERVQTARLVLRKPMAADAEAIFSRYANDPEVTRYLAWPRHQNIEDTRLFLTFSDQEWISWPAGPYLIESLADGTLLGSTGLSFKTDEIAETGYVLARDAWGQGFATEALGAIMGLSQGLGVRRLFALCHIGNPTSVRVLEKCGFAREELLPEHAEFPNLAPGRREDCLRYVLTLSR